MDAMGTRIILLLVLSLATLPPAARAYEVRLRGEVTRVRLPGPALSLETDRGIVYALLATGRDRVHAFRGGKLAAVRGTGDALHLYRYGGRLFFGADAGGGEIEGLRVVARHPLPEAFRPENDPILVYPVPPHGHLLLTAGPGYADGLPRARILHLLPGLAARHPREVADPHDPSDRIVFPPGERVALFRSIAGGRPALVYYDLKERGGARAFDAGIDPREPAVTPDGAVTLFRDARAADALRAHYRRPNQFVRLGGEAGRLPAPAPWTRYFAFLVTDGRAADLWFADFLGRSVALGGPRPRLPPRGGRTPSPVGVAAPGVYADLNGLLPVRPVFPSAETVAALRRDGDEDFLVVARFPEIFLDRPDRPIEGEYGHVPGAERPPAPHAPGKGGKKTGRAIPQDLRRLLGEER